MSSRNKARRRRPASPSPAAGRRQPPPPRRSPAPGPPPGPITESYMPPARRDLPELRGQLAHWLAGEGPGF
jgi:hypothetical protein